MAGIYGKSGNAYWEKQISGALEGLKNRPLPPVAQSNAGGASIGSTGIDWNKFNFGNNTPEEAPQEEESGISKVLNQPVIKGILDAVSVFNYAGANIADNMVDSAEAGKGPLSYIADIGEGIGEGLSAAFTGDTENARGYGEVIKRIQGNMGVDTESTSSKLVSGIGGFVGDVALDPTTYVGVGAAKAVAGGVKGASKFGKAEKANKVLDNMVTTGEQSADVANVLKKSVPGQYSDEFSDYLSKARANRGDAKINLGDGNSLPLDAIRPSRKAAEIEEVKLDFKAKNPEIPIREAAKGRIDAFKAGFDESLNKFRMEERGRKLAKRENSAVRKMMKVNPEQAVMDLVKLPFDNLTQNALDISESRLITEATKIVKTSDEIMGIERGADEAMALGADLAETIKADAQAGRLTNLNQALGSIAPDRQILHKGSKPKQYTPRQKKEIVERAVSERKLARLRGAEIRRAKKANGKSADDNFFDEVKGIDVPEGAIVNAVVDTEKAVDNNPWTAESITPPVAKEPEAPTPRESTPQEMERSAESYTDIVDDLMSDPHTYMRMRYRDVKEVEAVDAAFAFAKAVLPNGKTANGSSEFFYPDSLIERIENTVRFNAPDKEFIDLGIHPKDVEHARNGELSSLSSGGYERNFQTLVKHIRNLKSNVDASADTRYVMDEAHPLWDTVRELEEVFNVRGPRAVARKLVEARKSPMWTEAMRYATGERITKTDRHDLNGLTASVGEDTIRASLTLVPTEQTAEVWKANRAKAIEELSSVAPGLQSKIDSFIDGAINRQQTPGGKNTTNRVRATTDGDGKGAIINHHWNTHANIYALGKIQKEIRALKFDGTLDGIEQADRALMSSLRYYENTLREAGIDSHLTNMAEQYSYLKTREVTADDGTVSKITQEISNKQYAVRLGLSDVFGAMTPDLRAQFVFGKEWLRPNQFLDLAETLVRSAREIDPATGLVNTDRARLLTKLAVVGEMGDKRVINADGTTRLAKPGESWASIVKNGGRVRTREVHNNLDEETRLFVFGKAMYKMKDLDGKYLLSPEEFAKINQYDNVDDKINAMSVLLDGKNLDGDNLISAAMDKVKSTIYDDLVEAFFKPASDGRLPFNKLVEASIQNSMLVGRKITEPVAEFSADNVNRIKQAIAEGNQAKLIEAVATESKALDDLPIEAQKMIKDNKAETLAALPPKLVANAKAQSSVAEKVTPENANAVRKELVSDPEVDTKVIEEINPKTPEAAMVSTELLWDAGVNSFSYDLASKFGLRFNNSYGMPNSYAMVTSSTHTISALMDSMKRQFVAWEKEGITSKHLATSFNKIKNAAVKGNTELLSGTDKIVFDAFSTMFDTSKYNFFKANGIEGQAMNRFKWNLQHSFDSDVANLLGHVSEDMPIELLWTQLPVKDPYTFASKLFYTYAKTAQETQIAADFSKRFGVKVSDEVAKKQGLVKIVDKDEKNNFARMIDSDLFYPKELAEEVTYIDRMLNTDRGIANKQMRQFMENVWDPTVSILKLGQTSVKPGHHIMSIVGDMWRNLMLTGSPMTREYKQSIQLVKQLRANRKSELPMDALTRKLDSFMDYGEDIAGKASGTSISMNFNGKLQNIDINELITLGEKHGVFFAPHSGGVQEDLLAGASVGVDTGSKFKAVADKLLDNKYTQMLNAFSADRDGITRGALWLHYLQSKRFKSIEEAAIYAGDKVRKAAPVASDLSAWESKYMRRSVFYYTWLRGITPRVIETLLTRPGLAMIPSKGMYEMAEANGLDPNSFGDPMSEEVKAGLPDYYAERVLGPAFKDAETGDYWGFSPASPTIDVLNTLGSNIALSDTIPNPYSTEDSAFEKLGTTFVGMVTPWVKYPIEMATGKRMDTGAPIESNLQYMVDQNAISRTVSKLTGQVLPGLNRTESQYRDGMEDPAGNAGLELSNFLSNAQLMNYSADKVKKAAEFQQKDEVSAVNKLLARLGQTQEEE